MRNLSRVHRSISQHCASPSWGGGGGVQSRTYIHILNAFNCAPKGHTVVRGLPLIFMGGSASEAHCYSVPSARRRPRQLAKEIAAWDGVRALASHVARHLELGLRGLYLSLLFAPAVVTAPLALFFGIGLAPWAVLLRKTLEASGPAFIKWGQWASTRRDLFPAEICNEVSKLHTGVPCHSYGYTRRVVEEAFGQPIDEMFDFFEKKACASGSIAQVHKATLSPEGAKRIGMEAGIPVAVKVRHPDVETKLFNDFALMISAAEFMSKYNDATCITESVRQFEGPLFEQLDLSREAEHMKRFKLNFRRRRDVSFPTPLYPYVSSEVLVETFEDGVMFADVFKKKNEWNGKLAKLGLDTLFNMLLVDNFVHADMHPGNILISLKKPDLLSRLRTWYWGHDRPIPNPHITLLDTGMTTTLSDEDRTSLFKFFQSVSRLDGLRIAQSALKMSHQGDEWFDTKHQFEQEVKQTFDVFKAHMNRVGRLPPAQDCMHAVLDIFRKHNIGMKSELSVVIATMFMLEGWCTKLDPDLKVMKTIKEFTTPDRGLTNSDLVCTI